MKHGGLRIAALIVAPALLFAGLAAWQTGWWSDAAPTDLPAPFPSPHRTWAEHVAATDMSIATHRARAAREPTDWLSPAAEASTWLDRATMTGRRQDYDAALAAAAVSDSRAIAAVKAYALRARIALALHDNAAVEPLLRAATADLTFTQPAPQSEAAMLRGDVALYSGDWRAADAAYARAQLLVRSEVIAFRRAFIVERTQDGGAAVAAWLAVAQSTERPSRRLLSALALRLGGVELARGDWAEAARWHARAERYLPGDWHVAARRLQDQALAGDISGAITGMARLAAVHDQPELWDALALWQRAAGQDNGVALARARTGWETFAARYPHAVAGHRAEHALIAGDANAAVAFARANHANRPYGDAAILLATALNASGDIAGARSLLSRTTTTGWRSVESDRLMFELAALTGDSAAAEQARDAAELRNPRAFDPAMRLILFGLH